MNAETRALSRKSSTAAAHLNDELRSCFHPDNGTATEELRRREKEIEEFAAQAEAKAAREAKRNRPVRIAKLDA